MGRREDMTAEQRHSDNVKRRVRRQRCQRAQMERLDRSRVIHRADGSTEIVLRRGNDEMTLAPGPGSWRRDLFTYHAQTPYILGLTSLAKRAGWEFVSG